MVDEVDVVLSLHCRYCGRPFSLLYQRDTTQSEQETTYLCPYPDCPTHRVQRVTFSGTMLGIWRGHTKVPRDGEPVN